MAEQLDDSFSIPPYHGKGPRTKYPWDEWLNGKPWLLTAGADFKTDLDSFRTYVSRAARDRGLDARTHKVDSITLIIQAFPKENS